VVTSSKKTDYFLEAANEVEDPKHSKDLSLSKVRCEVVLCCEKEACCEMTVPVEESELSIEEEANGNAIARAEEDPVERAVKVSVDSKSKQKEGRVKDVQ